MKAYGKTWNYNVYSCLYCSYWSGKKIGCTYADGCCCPVPQTPSKRNRVTANSPPISICANCPYGRDFPCIGWCTKIVTHFASRFKERDKDNV